MAAEEFNVDDFINSAAPAGAMSTQVAQCPEGTYKMQIGPRDKWTMRGIEMKDGSTRRVLRVPFEVLDDAVRADLEREHVYVSKDFWLDMDETGNLDASKGKNVDLGRLREALGQNRDPEWTLAKLEGEMLTGKVTHRSDKDDPEKKYAEVQKFAALA